MRASLTVPFVSSCSPNLALTQGPATAIEAVEELSMDEWVALKEGSIPRKTGWPVETTRQFSPQAVHVVLEEYFDQFSKVWRDLPVSDRERIRHRVFTRDMMSEGGEIEFSHLLWPRNRKFFHYWAAGAIVYLFYGSELEDISDRFDARHLYFLRIVIAGYEDSIRFTGSYFADRESVFAEHLGAFGLSVPTLYEKYRGAFPMTPEELRMKIKARIEWGRFFSGVATRLLRIFESSISSDGNRDPDEKGVTELAEVLRGHFNEMAEATTSFNWVLSRAAFQNCEWILDALEGKSLVWKFQRLFEEQFFKGSVLPWWHFPGREPLQSRLLQSCRILRAFAESMEKSPRFSYWLRQRISFHETVDETIPWDLFCCDLASYLARLCAELDMGLKNHTGQTDWPSLLEAVHSVVGLGYALRNIALPLWEKFRKEVLRLNQVEPDDLIKILEKRLRENNASGG